MRMASGTTAISCTNNTASELRPCTLSNSPCSTSTLNTAAVLLRLTIPPTATAADQSSPKDQQTTTTASPVPKTCTPPEPSVFTPKPFSRTQENSSPKLNNSRATPNSAMASICPSDFTTCKLLGPPRNMPANKYPTNGLWFSLEQIPPNAKHAPNNTTTCIKSPQESMNPFPQLSTEVFSALAMYLV